VGNSPGSSWVGESDQIAAGEHPLVDSQAAEQAEGTESFEAAGL
jgi:hypothetical protein